ncbi:MAG: hypothetical protein JW807_13720 [Spirochaetes bacterium]|nr:hypothetical protein [Spirochaetota bacterium]
MRKIIACAAAVFVTMGGCVTMPDPVPDEYLVDKTADQEKTLEKLENAVIAKNHEARTMKEKLQEAEKQLKVEEGRLGILKNEKKLLEEKHKQYKLEDDTVRIDENLKMMVAMENEIQAQNNRVNHAEAVRDYAAAQKEVAEAGLSVQVAELRYERAQIARDYLVKRHAAVTDLKDKKTGLDVPPDRYDEKYRIYLDKQRDILAKKRAARDEAAAKVKIAEDKLVK